MTLSLVKGPAHTILDSPKGSSTSLHSTANSFLMPCCLLVFPGVWLRSVHVENSTGSLSNPKRLGVVPPILSACLCRESHQLSKVKAVDFGSAVCSWALLSVGPSHLPYLCERRKGGCTHDPIDWSVSVMDSTGHMGSERNGQSNQAECPCP